ncbi:MAG: hypothetical protein ABI852_12850, partial [Gemmatimonadaceae bacterium]
MNLAASRGLSSKECAFWYDLPVERRIIVTAGSCANPFRDHVTTPIGIGKFVGAPVHIHKFDGVSLAENTYAPG